VKFLLDTNAVSEWVKPRPNPGIVQWFDEVDEDRTFLSVITLGELRRGVDRLPNGRRRDNLERWLTGDLLDRFTDRVLPVDSLVADEWGRLLARAETAGKAIAGIDGLVAATANVHNMQVVTRNVRHFRLAGVGVICPWR
jgi:predicted nucleic acid-binding protein